MVVVPDPVWRRLERYLQQRPDVATERLPVRAGRAGVRPGRPSRSRSSGHALTLPACAGDPNSRALDVSGGVIGVRTLAIKHRSLVRC